MGNQGIIGRTGKPVNIFLVKCKCEIVSILKGRKGSKGDMGLKGEKGLKGLQGRFGKPVSRS